MVNAFFLLLKKTFPRGFQNLILIIKKKLCLHYLEFQSNQFAHGRRQGSNQILTYFPVEEPAVSVCHSLEERVPCPLSFQVKYPCKLFGIICLFSPINLFSLYQCGFLDVCLYFGTSPSSTSFIWLFKLPQLWAQELFQFVSLTYPHPPRVCF